MLVCRSLETEHDAFREAEPPEAARTLIEQIAEKQRKFTVVRRLVVMVDYTVNPETGRHHT